MPWNISNFKLWASINLFNIPIPFFNTTVPIWINLDVVQFSSDFELNNIPKAAITVALGRRMDNVDQVSAIHKIINFMKLTLPISVYLQAENTAHDGVADSWPTNKDGTPKIVRVFDGFTTGGGYSRSSTSAEYVLFMTHWLESLNFTSATSALFQPINLKQYGFLSATPDIKSGFPANMVGTTVAHNFIDSNVIKTDFWGYDAKEIVTDVLGDPNLLEQGGIKKWFLQLAQKDNILAPEIRATPGLIDTASGKNTDALAALNRMEPIKNINPDGGEFGKDYKWAVPLTMDLKIAADENYDYGPQAAEQVAEVVAAQTFETLSARTMWEKIVGEFGPMFYFSVVPRVETALVVPFIPGLRSTYTTITAEQYDSIRMNDDMPRTIKAVVLCGGVAFTAGGEGGRNKEPVYETIGGFFQGRPSGHLLMKDMPEWLSNVAMPHLDSFLTMGTDKPKATSLDPDASVKTGRDLTLYFTKAKQSLWDKVAQVQYMFEILRGRSGQLSGKLRFDIAPGSSVKIECTDEPFINGAFQQSVYGQVLRVSTYMNAETQRAGTAFHFAYKRSEIENTDNATSVARSPLWSSVWKGAPLVDEFEVKDAAAN